MNCLPSHVKTFIYVLSLAFTLTNFWCDKMVLSFAFKIFLTISWTVSYSFHIVSLTIDAIIFLFISSSVIYWLVRNGSTISALFWVVDIKGGSDYFSQCTFVLWTICICICALTKLQHLATRICSHSRNAITQTLRGILHRVRKYLDLTGPRRTVFYRKQYWMWKPNKMQSNFA